MKTEIITDNYLRDFFDIRDFCKQAEIENEYDMSKKNKNLCQTTLNMSASDWTSNSNSLMYRLYNKRDFSDGRGALIVIYDQDKIVASSGVSKLDDTTVLGGRRTFMLRSHRSKNLFADELLPPQIEWAKENGFKRILLAVNQYNDSVYRLLRRMTKSKSLLGINTNNIVRKFKEMPDLMEIKGVQQYVFYYDI